MLRHLRHTYMLTGLRHTYTLSGFNHTYIHAYIHTYIHTENSRVASINTSLTSIQLNSCFLCVRDVLSAWTSPACMPTEHSTQRPLRAVADARFASDRQKTDSWSLENRLIDCDLTYNLCFRNWNQPSRNPILRRSCFLVQNVIIEQVVSITKMNVLLLIAVNAFWIFPLEWARLWWTYIHMRMLGSFGLANHSNYQIS